MLLFRFAPVFPVCKVQYLPFLKSDMVLGSLSLTVVNYLSCTGVRPCQIEINRTPYSCLLGGQYYIFLHSFLYLSAVVTTVDAGNFHPSEYEVFYMLIFCAFGGQRYHNGRITGAFLRLYQPHGMLF